MIRLFLMAATAAGVVWFANSQPGELEAYELRARGWLQKLVAQPGRPPTEPAKTEEDKVDRVVVPEPFREEPITEPGMNEPDTEPGSPAQNAPLVAELSEARDSERRKPLSQEAAEQIRYRLDRVMGLVARDRR